MRKKFVTISVTVGSLVVPPEKTQTLEDCIDAMQEFVSRVEKGEVRSTKTYSKFKKLLADLNFEAIKNGTPS